MKNIRFLKLIAVMVSFLMFSEQALPPEVHASISAWVNPVSVMDKNPSIDQYRIPEQFVKSVRQFSGWKDKTFLIIQDAHVFKSAQQSIAAGLTYFSDHYGLDQVYVEGAEGELDTPMYSFFPNKKALAHVANHYLDQGRLTGAEFASIVLRPSLNLYGIEDKALYQKNRQAYLDVQGTKRTYSQLIASFEEVMEGLSRFVLSEDLRELSQRRYEYQKKDLQAYANYLIKLSQTHHIKLASYSSVQKYSELTSGEEVVNPVEAENDFRKLLELIQDDLPIQIKKKWLDRSTKLNLYDLKVKSFLKFLKEARGEIYERLPKDYPHLALFLSSMEFAQFSGEEFLSQLEELSWAIEVKLLATQDQHDFLELYRVLEVYKKMFKLNLTKEDVRYFQYHREKFDVKEIIKFLNPKLEKYKFAFELPCNFKDLENGLSKVESFYTIALNRDQVLASRAVDRMESSNKNFAAFVVGGFHVPGIENYLKEQGYSYIVLTPEMKQVDSFENSETLYHDAMMHKPTRLENTVQSFNTLVRGELVDDSYFQLVPELFMVTKDRMNAMPRSTFDFYQLTIMKSLFDSDQSLEQLISSLKSMIPGRRRELLDSALSGFSPGVLEVRKSGSRVFWKPAFNKEKEILSFEILGQVVNVTADYWHSIGSYKPRDRSIIPWDDKTNLVYVRDIDPVFVPGEVLQHFKGNVSAVTSVETESAFFFPFQEETMHKVLFSNSETLESKIEENSLQNLDHFFPRENQPEQTFVFIEEPTVESNSSNIDDGKVQNTATVPLTVSSINVLPEILTLALLTFLGGSFWGLPIYFLMTRALWNSAFLSHGFGHVLLKRIVDRSSATEWSEASEGFSVKDFLQSMIPFSPIYTPWISPSPDLISVGDTEPLKVAFKAIAGPLANFFGAALFLGLLMQTLNNPYSSFAFAMGSFLYFSFAVLSVSDYTSFFKGAAECGYGCGILWVTADRDEADDKDIYPKRIESVLSDVLYYMSLFGSHGVGAGAQFVDSKTGELDYAHFKMPSGYGQHPFFYKRVGRTAVIQQFLEFFKSETSRAKSQRAIAGKFWNIAGHVRLKTSGGKLEVETTQPFYINTGQKIRHWVREGDRMVVREIQNIAYSAANGDNQKARLPGDEEGPYFSESDWGNFFERIYSTPIGANDSEKAAYMIYFLRTQGSFEDSLRLAYVATFFKDLKDKIPTRQQFKKWAKQIEPLVEVYGTENWTDPENIEKLVQEAIQILPRDDTLPAAPEREYEKFIEYAMHAFQKNDAYFAAKTMMTMVNAYSTYGFFFESTLDPGQRVLISREQPVAIAENMTKKIQLGGSSLKFLKTAIWGDSSYEKGDHLRSFKLDMTKDHDDRGGEIALMDYNTHQMRVYSMNTDHELTAEEIEARWKDATHDEPDWIAPTLDDDKMLNDLMNSLAVTKAIHGDWVAALDAESASLKAGKAFSDRWIENAQSLDQLNRVLQREGINAPAQHAAPDLFIVVFREENIVVGQWFNKLMKETYPLANIQIVNGNEYIQSIESHPLSLNTNTLFVDLGFNFPVIRAAEEHERRAQRANDTANNEIDLTVKSDDTAQTEATWNVLKLLEDRKPPHVFIIAPSEGTNVSESFELGSAHVITSKYFPDVDGGTAVSWSQIVSLLELYLHSLKSMRDKFPKGAPLGLTLTQKDIRGVRESYENMIRSDLPEILGFSIDARGRVLKLKTPANQNLNRLAEELLPYFTEQARATAISTVHLLVAVAFTGTVIQIVAGFVLSGFGPLWGFSSLGLSFLSHLLDVPLFLFFKWLSVLSLRISENREPLHRDQNPSIVLGDDQWSRLVRVNLSKMFALAKGIISPTAIYDSKQLSELEGKHGHDARRGTMIFLSTPTNHSSSDAVQAAHSGVGLLQSQAESFASLNAVGPLMIGIMDVSEQDAEAFKLGHHASIYSKRRDQLHLADRFDNPQQVGRILELAMDGPLRMLSHMVVFVKIIQWLQDIKLGYPLQWHRGDNQNSIGATTQAPIRPPAPEWFSGEENVNRSRGRLEKDNVEEVAPAIDEIEEVSVRIEKKLPWGGVLATNDHRPTKRSELRSDKKGIRESDLIFQKLEKRFSLNGDEDTLGFASLSSDQSFTVSDTYLVSYEGVGESTPRFTSQQRVSYDPSGNNVEILMTYSMNDDELQLKFLNFRNNEEGSLKAFNLIEIKNGKFLKLLEAKVTEYDDSGKALKAEIDDRKSNRIFEILFTTLRNNVLDIDAQAIATVIVKTEDNMIVIKNDLKNTVFVEAEDGEEEVVKKKTPEKVLADVHEEVIEQPKLVSTSSTANEISILIDLFEPKLKKIGEEGLAPKDAIEMMPDAPDVSEGPVDIAEGEAANPEDLVIEDFEPVEGQGSSEAENVRMIDPPASVIALESPPQAVATDQDEDIENRSALYLSLAKIFLAINVFFGTIVFKMENIFSVGRFPILFISGALFYTSFPVSMWIFFPSIIGIFIAVSLIGRGSEKPQLSLNRGSTKLKVVFPIASGLQVKLQNGNKIRSLTLNRNGTQYEMNDSVLTAVYDKENEEFIVSSKNDSGVFFVHNDEDGQEERFLTLSLPYKRENPWAVAKENISVGKLRENSRRFIAVGVTVLLSFASVYTLAQAQNLKAQGINSLLVAESNKSANSAGFTIETLYWGSVLSVAVFSLIILQKLFGAKGQRPLGSWISQLVFLGSFFVIGKILIIFSPVQTVLIGITFFYLFTLVGYYIINPIRWIFTLLTFPLRWIPSIGRLTTIKQNFVAFAGVGALSATAFLVYSRHFSAPEIDNVSKVQTAESFTSTVDLNLDAEVKDVLESVAVKEAVTLSLAPLSYDFKGRAPLIYDSNIEASSVEILSPANGYLKLSSVDPKIAPAEWIIPKTTFKVKGAQPLLTLQRPDVDAKAKSVGDFSKYLQGIHEDFEGSGIYRILPRARRLIDLGEGLAKQMENYGAQQEVDVFGEIRVPLRSGEEGWIIPSPRSFGNTIDDSVLARVHSQNRLTVQVAVPMAVWKNHDLLSMNVSVLTDGEVVSARIVEMNIQPRLDGQIILTLALSSDRKIFEWNEDTNSPKSVDIQVEVPLKFKTISYSDKLPPQIMFRSYAQFDKRISVAVNPSAVVGRVDFKHEEASWVLANEVVAGIDAKDRESLGQIIEANEAFTTEIRDYLKDLQTLIDKRAAEKYPVEVKKFAEYFVVMQELLSRYNFLEFRSPQMGILTGTYDSQGQAFLDKPIAEVLTPEISIHHRIQKSVPLNLGDVVVIRRTTTGEETLGIVRQINDELPSTGEGEDQSNFREVLIQVYNTPELWFADHEYGIEVIYVSDERGQAWLKRHYQDQQARFKNVFAEANRKTLPQLFPIRFLDAAVDTNQQLLIQLLESSTSLKIKSDEEAPKTFDDLPRLVQQEQSEDYAMPEIPFDNAQINRIAREANGDLRREWMSLYLQSPNIPLDEIEYIVLKGSSDVGQMSLDYLLEQKRVIDLIQLHRKLYAKSPELDMTKLARAHVLELIEHSEDTLKRLIQLDHFDERRPEVQEFLISVLAKDQAIFDFDESIVARKILISDFWRTYGEQLALAESIESASEEDPLYFRRQELATLIRNHVFIEIAQEIGWKLGEPEEEAQGLSSIKRFDREIWYRLRSIVENDRQDRDWLMHSPWALSYEDPREYFKGRINDQLFQIAADEYEGYLTNLNADDASPITVLDFEPATGSIFAEHVFKRLDLQAQRNYVESLEGHALERFVEIAERKENEEYRKRREQIISQLVSSEKEGHEILLARLFLKTNDEKIIGLLMDKEIDRVLIEVLGEKNNHLDLSEEELLLFQQAVAKISSLNRLSEGVRVLALRTLLESLSDFEVTDFLNHRHGLFDLLKKEGVSEEALTTLANEEVNRRASYWAIDLASEWSALTIDSQVYSASQSSLHDIREALEIEGFYPERLEVALKRGYEKHGEIFARYDEFYKFRKAQILNGSQRDKLSHLETSRLSIGTKISLVSLIFGVLIRFFGFLTLSHRGNSKRRSFLSKFFLWSFFAVGFFAVHSSEVQAQNLILQTTPSENLNEGELEPFYQALDAKEALSKEVEESRYLDFSTYEDQMQVQGLNFNRIVLSAHDYIKADLESVKTSDQGEMILNYRNDLHTENFVLQLAELMRTNSSVKRLSILRDKRTVDTDWQSLQMRLKDLNDFSKLRIVFVEGDQSLEDFVRDRNELRKVSHDAVIQISEPKALRLRDQKGYDRILLGAAPLAKETILVLGGEKQIYKGVNFLTVTDILDTILKAQRRIASSA